MKRNELQHVATARLTRRQGAIVSAYTGRLACNFVDLHAYVEELLGRPVFVHEMGDTHIVDQIRERARADFLAISSGDDDE